MNAPAPGEAVTTVPQMMALPAGSLIAFTSPKGRGAAVKLVDGTWEATGVQGSVYDGLLLLEITGITVVQHGWSRGPGDSDHLRPQVWNGPCPDFDPRAVIRFPLEEPGNADGDGLEPPRLSR